MNVFLNPELDIDIEECHYNLWKEIEKNNKEVISNKIGSDTDLEYPRYISFSQYLYAEEHGCRSCRKFVKEYDRLISHSAFVHLFDFRYYLKLLLNEFNCIKNSLLYDFGVEYEDESQQQTANFYYSWAKMAENHTRLIAQELTEQADELPTSEVDKITQTQAARFQAFFSIRIASYTEVIDNLLFSLKKYLEDTCDIFYKKHVSPSIQFKSKVATPLELDILTTRLLSDAPTLSEEVVTIVNAFKGNFGAVLTDMLQRKSNIEKKFDRLYNLNIQRRKYINYIDQLSSKGSHRPKVILDIKDDEYKDIFNNIIIDQSLRTKLTNSHDQLDDLELDHHPQYLLRSGGTIFGDILVEDGVLIDGVDISDHSHSGSDGSNKIKASDIDYETVKQNTTILQSAEGNQLSVNVESFNSDIRTGGVPVVDAVLAIEVPDDVVDKYEYEIIYTENS